MTKKQAPQQAKTAATATRAIEPRAIDSLVPYVRNARTHSDEQVAQIAASLAEFGWTNPILIADGQILAGHGRLLAARKVLASGAKIPQWEDPATVPTISLDHLTPVQRKAYILADNKLALNAGWDFEMLSVELDELRDADFDLSLLGWEQQELNDLIGTPNIGPLPESSTNEIDPDEFAMGRKCPKCGFEFEGACPA